VDAEHQWIQVSDIAHIAALTFDAEA
jgi:hypothetical protein